LKRERLYFCVSAFRHAPVVVDGESANCIATQSYLFTHIPQPTAGLPLVENMRPLSYLRKRDSSTLVTEMMQVPYAALEVPIEFLSHIIARRRRDLLCSVEYVRSAGGSNFLEVAKLQDKVRHWAEFLPWYERCRVLYVTTVARSRDRPVVTDARIWGKLLKEWLQQDHVGPIFCNYSECMGTRDDEGKLRLLIEGLLPQWRGFLTRVAHFLESVSSKRLCSELVRVFLRPNIPPATKREAEEQKEQQTQFVLQVNEIALSFDDFSVASLGLEPAPRVDATAHGSTAEPHGDTVDAILQRCANDGPILGRTLEELYRRDGQRFSFFDAIVEVLAQLDELHEKTFCGTVDRRKVNEIWDWIEQRQEPRQPFIKPVRNLSLPSFNSYAAIECTQELNISY
jgi:hypothetical protein